MDIEQTTTAFIQQYYTWFDDPAQRHQLSNLYNDTSLMTFEGKQINGFDKIMEMFGSLPLQKVIRVISNVDCQSMSDGRIIANVAGQLQTNDAPLMLFKQTFVLCITDERCFIQHDIFRIIVG